MPLWSISKVNCVEYYSKSAKQSDWPVEREGQIKIFSVLGLSVSTVLRTPRFTGALRSDLSSLQIRYSVLRTAIDNTKYRTGLRDTGAQLIDAANQE